MLTQEKYTVQDFLPPDHEQRQQALDPAESFIIQAPAGSGKTELLIQRFLVLLTRAQSPEEIIAITFTRKAAAEMRSRILLRLQQATTTLAKAALTQDQAMGWKLLENPNRLRIQTIDALCSSITRQMPLLSGLGLNPILAQDPHLLYRDAAQELFACLETDSDCANKLSTLLLHLDNDANQLILLFADMLSHRDQWLDYLHIQPNAETRLHLENSLQYIRHENAARIHATIPSYLKTELISLAHFAAQHVDADSPIFICKELSELPPPEDHPVWQGLAALLLTQNKSWRKTVRKSEGFSPSFQDMKTRMISLLESCASYPSFHQALTDYMDSPPAHYSDQQWEIIVCLLDILPFLAAQLDVTFKLHKQVDYTEIALSAHRALGDDANPTDLALALDYRIQHLLIDEFQDTSVMQFRLIERLTAGWQPEDQRTLFLVGDPMQSIYRFRKAEVGLFLRAKQQGIGAIPLKSITLSSNFRSQKAIVDWVNAEFSKKLPSVENIASGAVAYSPSIAIHPSQDLPAVFTYPDIDIGKNVLSIIQNTNPQNSIAILVRSKSHLLDILPILQKAKISYRAVEIETLNQQSVIQDLLALTRALLNLADRIAWLAILRAPWCGLTLAELLAINHSPILWDSICRADIPPRLVRFRFILENSLKQRSHLPLRQWIESTWLALKGPACVETLSDLENAQTFFSLLENYDEYLDVEQLETQIQKLYAAPNLESIAQVDIMTLHKAKGLEFDTVIIPGFWRRQRHDDPPLLRWMERPRAQGDITDLLLAPVKASTADTDSLYDYLRREEMRKQKYEMDRLLYVGTTRAKKTLHLLGYEKTEEEEKEKIFSLPVRKIKRLII